MTTIFDETRHRKGKPQKNDLAIKGGGLRPKCHGHLKMILFAVSQINQQDIYSTSVFIEQASSSRSPVPIEHTVSVFL